MRRFLGTFFLATLLAGCGGGSGASGNAGSPDVIPGGSTSSSVGGAATGFKTASSAFALSGGSQTFTLPAAGTTTGTMQTMTSLAPAATTMSVTSEAAPPQTTTPVSGVLTSSVFALELSVNATTVLGGLPEFTLTDPRFAGVSAAGASFELYGDAACTKPIAGGGVTSISGDTASIIAGTTPVTLSAGDTYTFVFSIATPSVQSALFLDASNNAVIAVDVSDAKTPAASYILSGPKTGIDAPQDVASGPGGEVIVLNREQYPAGGLTFGNYYMTTSSALVFERDAQGNSEPAQTLNASGDVYTRLATAPTGIVYAWSKGFGPGSLAGLKYLFGPATQTYVNTQVPQQGDYLGFDDVALTPSGLVTYDGSEASTTGFFDVLCIGATCSQAPPYNALTNAPQNSPYFDYTSMAFNPVNGNLYAVAPALAATTPEIDVYPPSGFVLDQPTARIALPAGTGSASAMQFDAAGNAYIFAKAASGDREVIVYTPAALTAAAPTRTVDVEAVLSGHTTSGFAVQTR